MAPYFIIILIILIVGLFGGGVNYFMLNPADPDNVTELKGKHVLLMRSLFMGVAASVLVPLFLNTISSSVLTDILAGRDVYKNYFVFTGFCLIAAISSRRFIGDLYERIMKIEQTANEAKGKAGEAKDDAAKAKLSAHKAISQTQDLINAATEPDEAEVKSLVTGALMPRTANAAPDHTEKLIHAFTQSRYTFRTLKGLSQDSGLPEAEVIATLNELEENGKVKSQLNAKGNTVWQLVYG